MNGLLWARTFCLIGCFGIGIPAAVLFYLASRRMKGRIATVIRFLAYGLFLMIVDAIIRDVRSVFGGLHAESAIIYLEVMVHTIGEVLFLLASWVLYRSLQLIGASEESLVPARARGDSRLLFKAFHFASSPFVFLKKLPCKLAVLLNERGWVAEE